MNKPETRLRKKMVEAAGARYGSRIYIKKIHGSPYQDAGIPDLIGCLDGHFFGCEVKMPGGHATDIQHYNLKKIAGSGGMAFVAHSVDELFAYLDVLYKS